MAQQAAAEPHISLVKEMPQRWSYRVECTECPWSAYAKSDEMGYALADGHYDLCAQRDGARIALVRQLQGAAAS